MEACGSAHYWGRRFEAQGMRVSLLPPHYVRAYVRRNKTDSADATALLEAARASDIVPVRMKSVEQQGLQGLHRLRSCWRATCTARINTLRGLCKELGVIAPLHSRGVAELRRRLAEDDVGIPEYLRFTLQRVLGEIDELEERLLEVEAQLAEIAKHSTTCQRLQTIPGVGLIVSTAFTGAVGDIAAFRSARHFASWLGLTPREYSSGNIRQSVNVATDISGCCSCMARVPFCIPVQQRFVPGGRWIHCEHGAYASETSVVSRRRRWPSRTNWPAFYGPPGGTNETSSLGRRAW